MIQSKPQSRCMFCNSTAYGTGCAYSPHRKHVHITDGNKCIYCGSTSVGMGCPLNPFSKMHVRGVEFNMMSKESIHKSVMTSLFLERLIQPIQEMPAFKLGLIDENGCKIKECESIEEQTALTPLDIHILKIRRLIGEDVLDLFKSNVLLEMVASQKPEKFNAEQYQREVKLSASIAHIIEDLHEVFANGAEQGFSRAHIENIILESILKKYEDSKD